MTEIIKQVAASSDDCHIFGTTIRLTRPDLFIDECTFEIHAYMRFLNMAIPPGAIIEHAHLEVCSYGSNGGRSVMTVYGIKEPNTNTFSTQPDADLRPMTTAFADWVCGATGFEQFWDVDSWHGWPDGPELMNIIQEIVNQPGWASGNPLAMKIVSTPVGGQGRIVWAYDGSPALAPMLHVTYSMPTGFLAVTSTPPGASVFINQELLGTTPLSLELEVGQYEVALKLAGYVDYIGIADIVAGQTTTIDPVLVPIPTAPSKVTGLNATNIAETSFRASWNGNPPEEGVTLYRVYLRKL